MKTIKLLLLPLFFLISQHSYCQVPAVTGAQCVECGGMNGYHKTTCKYYNPPTKTSSSGSSLNVQQQIIFSLFSNLLSGGSNNQQAAQQKAQQEERQREEAIRQQKLAMLLARQKEINDSITQANHDKMMKEYKQLDGSGDLGYKGLDDKPKLPQVHFNCKITGFSGKVIVLKSNGQQIALSGAQSVDLAPGDWIATGENSRIKLHYAFENGGEEITLMPKSGITIGLDENGSQVPKLIQGGIHAVNLKSGMEQYYQEGGGIIDQATFEANKLQATVRNKLRLKVKLTTVNAAIAIRGTEFTVNVDEFANTVVNVKEGIVDLTGNVLKGTITLTAGTKGIVKATGEIVGPLKMDEKQFEDKDKNGQ